LAIVGDRQTGKEQAGDRQAGKEQAGNWQAGNWQAGKEQAGDRQAVSGRWVLSDAEDARQHALLRRLQPRYPFPPYYFLWKF
jgi:hypothetical protein